MTNLQNLTHTTFLHWDHSAFLIAPDILSYVNIRGVDRDRNYFAKATELSMSLLYSQPGAAVPHSRLETASTLSANECYCPTGSKYVFEIGVIQIGGK